MNQVEALRRASRKLVRELGIIDLDKKLAGPTPQHCHALVEIAQKPGITVSELGELLLLSVSAASRLVRSMATKGFVRFQDGVDKREKSLYLTLQGKEELRNIDDFSHAKVMGAFEYLAPEEREAIIRAIEKYGQALEKSRTVCSKIKILTLSTSRSLRKQILSMVEKIQREELQVPVGAEENSCILKAEEEFYYNRSYNFWYAVDSEGMVIGCIGLRKMDESNGQVKKMFVDKRMRGKGIAQKLMGALFKAAAKHGFKRLWLGTVENAVQARNFYIKCGFHLIEESALLKGFGRCPLDTKFLTRSVIQKQL